MSKNSVTRNMERLNSSRPLNFLSIQKESLGTLKLSVLLSLVYYSTVFSLVG